MSHRSHRFPRTAALLVLGLLAAGVAPAFAQGAGLKIAVVDTQKILQQSKPGRAALEELKKLQEQKQNEAKAKQDELQKLRDELDDKRLSLSEDKLSQMKDQLDQRVVAFRRFQEDAQNELNKRRDELLEKIEGGVMPVINQVGKEGGFTMIFRKYESGLIYVDEAIDITDQVIQRLEKAEAAAPAAKGGN